jgi:hypothetical protein
MVVSSQPATVVLPELVAPATQTEIPYRRQAARKSSISSVALPPFTKSAFGHVLWVDDTDGGGHAHVLVHYRRFQGGDADVLWLRWPSVTTGLALSSNHAAEAWSIRRMTLTAWCRRVEALFELFAAGRLEY